VNYSVPARTATGNATVTVKAGDGTTFLAACRRPDDPDTRLAALLFRAADTEGAYLRAQK